ncbi:hypothetical protein PM082_007023 [Marasmius tenuissimus]|nr:hypothetical protein PM082_007023 [Marasmius tenuissimus]
MPQKGPQDVRQSEARAVVVDVAGVKGDERRWQKPEANFQAANVLVNTNLNGTEESHASK